VWRAFGGPGRVRREVPGWEDGVAVVAVAVEAFGPAVLIGGKQTREKLYWAGHLDLAGLVVVCMGLQEVRLLQLLAVEGEVVVEVDSHGRYALALWTLSMVEAEEEAEEADDNGMR
jgi:hypothetical protein